MTFSLPDTFPAFLATRADGPEGKPTVTRSVGELRGADLPEGEVTIRVAWSGVNYKDALATLADGGVARISPLVAGVDISGVVVAVDGSTSVNVGDEVIAHGYEIGVARHGGYASFARVRATDVFARPADLTMRQAMVVGTAGFTAAQSVDALERAGLTPGTGPVLVTGATGGVGSTAVGMLARRGYEVVASTGKANEHDFLTALGAAAVIDRAELASAPTRPLEKERWAGAVDCVGGTTLATVIRQLRYGASVAASGLTGGTGLDATVLPFILRGVSLLGIDSVQASMSERVRIWDRCATDLRPVGLDDSLVNEIGLDGLDAALTAVRAGLARGRFLVSLA